MGLKHNVVVFFRKHHLTETKFYKFLTKLNFEFFHQDMKEQENNYGTLNPDKTFYVIREGTKENGLLSMYMRALQRCVYALDKGFVPFFDGKTWPTQYNGGQDINSWELFFNQPTEVPLEEIYKSKNVILAGNNISDYNELTKQIAYAPYCDEHCVSILYKICHENIFVKDCILQEVDSEYRDLFSDKTVLGVYMRGTDYTSLKPAGHYVQPDLNTVLKDIERYLKQFKIDMIFLVTEDDKIYHSVASFYGEKMISYNDYRFTSYNGKDFLAGSKKEISVQEIGKIYLKKIMLLSRCDYLIGGITNGTQFALIMNNNQYKDKILYNLGKY